MQEKNPVQSQTHTHPHSQEVNHPGHPIQNPSLNHPLITERLQAPLMRKMNPKSKMPLILAASVLIVFAGVATGWFLSGGIGSSSSVTSQSSQQKNGIKQSDNEAGVTDTKDFPDTATGKLIKGGIDGEGTYHLERDGGPSQNVYLSSTVIDLASFEGKKVQVWGQSLSGKKAGWLMDVGKVKVVE